MILQDKPYSEVANGANALPNVKQILLRWGIKPNWKISEPSYPFFLLLSFTYHVIINVRVALDRYVYTKVVCRIACRSLLFTVRSRVTMHGPHDLLSGPTPGQRHPPVAECGSTDRGCLRVYTDKLVTDSHHPLEKLPLSLYLSRSSINRSAVLTWPVESRMTRARDWIADGKSAIFFTHSDPRDRLAPRSADD